MISKSIFMFAVVICILLSNASLGMYDPQPGRFMQRDPLGIDPMDTKANPFRIISQCSDGLNLYEYVNSNCILKIDPMGLMADSITIGLPELIIGGGITAEELSELLGVTVIVADIIIERLKGNPPRMPKWKKCDCPKWQKRALQKIVKKTCGKERRCDQWMSRSELVKRRAINFACAGARGTINSLCFKGGDIGHVQAMMEALAAGANCQSILNTRKP